MFSEDRRRRQSGRAIWRHLQWEPPGRLGSLYVAQSCRNEMGTAIEVKSAELASGVTLPYVEQGDPSGLPLLLVPGYMDSWRAFEPMLPFIPEWVHALALTLRGHGEASRPQDGYRIPDFAADLVEFMDLLQVEAAVLAGGSSGGLVARRVAIDHPQRTLGLVFLGSPSDLRGNLGVRRLWDEDVSKLTDPVNPLFVREFQEGNVRHPVSQDFLDTMVQESLKVPARVWKATLKGLMEDDSFEQLHRIEAPTLIIWGDHDIFLPREDQEALAAAIPGSRLVVYRGAGHALYWEQPEQVAIDLVRFVGSLGD